MKEANLPRSWAALGWAIALGSASGAAAALGVPAYRSLGASSSAITARTAGARALRDGVFENFEPATDTGASNTDMMRRMMQRGDIGKPARPISVVTPEIPASPAALAATWLGHATVLAEIDGVRVLTDPVLSARCSPSQTLGPARMHRAPADVAGLGPIDVVLISHDHYDHLDTETVVALARDPKVQFVAPIGVGAHLRSFGVREEAITESQWGDEVSVAGLRFACRYARHFSGRGMVRNQTQWASWAVIGPSHSMYFCGDTGFTPRFADPQAEFGPFDLTLVPIGAYDPLWPDIHANPEEAVEIHQMLSGGSPDSVMLPIHWGTFNLALHTWEDPPQRLAAAAAARDVTTLTPRPGVRVDLSEQRRSTVASVGEWWKEIV